MSLAIDITKVHRVLLMDGWHHVWNKTFQLDSYEFLQFPDSDKNIHNTTVLHGGGASGVCATGFTFMCRIESPNPPHQKDPRIIWMYGPLTAIQAVEIEEDK